MQHTTSKLANNDTLFCGFAMSYTIIALMLTDIFEDRGRAKEFVELHDQVQVRYILYLYWISLLNTTSRLDECKSARLFRIVSFNLSERPFRCLWSNFRTTGSK